MEDKERRSESLVADLENKNLAGNNFEIDLAEKIVMKVFKILFFAICIF